jgi:hypothetical protein
LKTIANQDARRFYLTYFSSEARRPIEAAPMFSSFVNFLNNVLEMPVLENDDNRKEFISKIDKDLSLKVDLKELNDFFNAYISIA